VNTIEEAAMPDLAQDRASGLDFAGFDLALNAHRGRLYGIAYTILRNHADAEDALQGALLRAWRGWPRLADRSVAGAWLTRICVNQCIDHRRSLLARRRHEADIQPSTPDEAQLRGALLDLDRAFLKLSRRQRAVLTLHHHHGYSVDECAEILGCGSGSVRTHLARAIARLREEMTR
jgi:RNA polymerase sigma-70 factor (ECF subfamily)